jgi:hypothetical protein
VLSRANRIVFASGVRFIAAEFYMLIGRTNISLSLLKRINFFYFHQSPLSLSLFSSYLYSIQVTYLI